VFAESNVSFTCEVNREKEVQWWATVESGRMPVRCGLLSCLCCSRADYPPCASRCARLVVKSEGLWGGELHTHVAISNLDAESVAVVESRVVSLLVNSVAATVCGWRPSDYGMVRLFSRLGNGMFSMGALCECDAEAALCKDCRVVLKKKQRRFTVLDWWHALGGMSQLNYWDDVGVSDAVGMHWLYGRERQWLACPDMFLS
jgi:hypothetical protein